jgi:hypothetical protein
METCNAYLLSASSITSMPVTGSLSERHLLLAFLSTEAALSPVWVDPEFSSSTSKSPHQMLPSRRWKS